MRKWLEECRDHWPAHRSRGNLGYRAMQAGLTQWNYVDADGNNYTVEQARMKFGDRYWDFVTVNGERLTKDGLWALEGDNP